VGSRLTDAGPYVDVERGADAVALADGPRWRQRPP
jgi:hypothetical protein